MAHSMRADHTLLTLYCQERFSHGHALAFSLPLSMTRTRSEPF